MEETIDSSHGVAPRSLSAASRTSGNMDLKRFHLHFCPAQQASPLMGVTTLFKGVKARYFSARVKPFESAWVSISTVLLINPVSWVMLGN